MGDTTSITYLTAQIYCGNCGFDFETESNSVEVEHQCSQCGQWYLITAEPFEPVGERSDA